MVLKKKLKLTNNKKSNEQKSIKKKNESISRLELIDRVWKATNNADLQANKDEIGLVINIFLDEINNALIKGEKIRLQGTFTLKTAVRKEHKGRNPKTGKKVNVPTKYFPKCVFHSSLKEKVSKRKIEAKSKNHEKDQKKLSRSKKK